MQEIVVIDGEIKLENVLDGEVELEAITDLDPEVVIGTGGAVYPHYTGSYTVTPSGSVQTLDTSDKVMDDDVTVQAVTQGSATTPATIITANPTLSRSGRVVTATVSKTQSVTPTVVEGYVSAGTAGNIGVSGSDTLTIPEGSATTPATTITANPTISVSSGGLITAKISKTQSVTPTVVEGYVSAGTAGNVSASGYTDQQLSTQSAQTLHPSTMNQTIASGKYLTGALTFKAVTVSGLTADKVVQGNVVKIGDADDDDRIMSVTGTASGGITPTGTKTITANGTGIDVYSYQYADVAVPNSYSASDEGKVVSNGALVAQTSDTVTANDTYDTTLINSLTVNVSGGGGISADDIAMRAISGAIVLNTATEIKAYAFNECTGITSLYSNTVTTVGESACYNIDADIILPNVTTYGQNAFNYSNGDIILPNIKTIVNTCRYTGGAGKIVCFSRAEGSLPTDCFRTTYATIMDIGYVDTIGQRCFYQGNDKTVLIIRYTGGVVNASATNAISTIPNSCKVYVPSALLTAYQSATSWSSKDLQVLEGSIYEDEDWALS